MIGQRTLLNHIHKQILNDRFPRFAIFIGEQGSGRRTLASNVGENMKSHIVVGDIKVDAIREIITNSYKVADKTLYIIPNADNMSPSASNAILKITEEPPNNAYFILTCESADNLLQTIRSRGVTYILEPYTYNEKCDYINEVASDISDDDEEFILEVASNIGEIRQLLKMNISEFKNYINLVIDNIAEVSGSNAFKIADKIALKDEEDKYDARLFWKAFSSICAYRMTSNYEAESCLKYAHAVAITGDVLQQLSIRGINKQMLFDKWILDIRSEWL